MRHRTRDLGKNHDPGGDPKKALHGQPRSKNKIIQGTGFFLQEWGFVTCAHCVGDRPFVYNPENPSEKFDAVVTAKNEELDLAILKIKGREDWPSSMSVNLTAQPEVRDGVLLVGYPGYAPGKSISIKPSGLRQGWLASTAPSQLLARTHR